MRVVYFGTPRFAVPALRALAADPAFDVRLVVSQPDRPAGRGQRLESPPVAQAAVELGLPLHQVSSLRDEDARMPLVEANADLFVVAAFGLIFGKKTLAIPRLGCVNLHASLLPQYRGANPIMAAIVAGERETGVTLMEMELGLDTGAMIDRVVEPIREDDTTQSVTERLADAGAALAVRSLPRYAAGELSAIPQPDRGATVARMVTKADGWIDWNRPAEEIERHVRAMWPWPRAWTTREGAQVQVHRAGVVGHEGRAIPGMVIRRKPDLVVACGRGGLRLDVVQPAGRGPMDGPAFAGSLPDGFRFGMEGDPGPRPPLVEPA